MDPLQVLVLRVAEHTHRKIDIANKVNEILAVSDGDKIQPRVMAAIDQLVSLGYLSRKLGLYHHTVHTPSILQEGVAQLQRILAYAQYGLLTE